MFGPRIRLLMTTRMRYPDMEDVKCDTIINVLIITWDNISHRHCQSFMIKRISHIANILNHLIHRQSWLKFNFFHYIPRSFGCLLCLSGRTYYQQTENIAFPRFVISRGPILVHRLQYPTIDVITHVVNMVYDWIIRRKCVKGVLIRYGELSYHIRVQITWTIS